MNIGLNEVRKCKNCGKFFEVQDLNQKYCFECDAILEDAYNNAIYKDKWDGLDSKSYQYIEGTVTNKINGTFLPYRFNKN